MPVADLLVDRAADAEAGHRAGPLDVLPDAVLQRRALVQPCDDLDLVSVLTPLDDLAQRDRPFVSHRMLVVDDDAGTVLSEVLHDLGHGDDVALHIVLLLRDVAADEPVVVPVPDLDPALLRAGRQGRWGALADMRHAIVPPRLRRLLVRPTASRASSEASPLRRSAVGPDVATDRRRVLRLLGNAHGITSAFSSVMASAPVIGPSPISAALPRISRFGAALCCAWSFTPCSAGMAAVLPPCALPPPPPNASSPPPAVGFTLARSMSPVHEKPNSSLSSMVMSEPSSRIAATLVRRSRFFARRSSTATR